MDSADVSRWKKSFYRLSRGSDLEDAEDAEEIKEGRVFSVSWSASTCLSDCSTNYPILPAFRRTKVCRQARAPRKWEPRMSNDAATATREGRRFIGDETYEKN
jgi:hypothetical protein